MARERNKLTDLEIRRCKTPGWLSDGGHLYCRVSPAEHGGGKRWVLRYTHAGRKREMGLGDATVVPLAEARDARDKALKALRDGRDPIEERRTVEATQRTERTARLNQKTFQHAAESEIARRKSGWRLNGAAASRTSDIVWRRSLMDGCEAFLGKPVEDVSQGDVIQALKPFWDRGAHVSAQRLRDRIKAVIDHAIAHGWRTSANPVTKERFAKIEPVQREDNGDEGHHAALPYHAMPALMASLRAVDAMSSLAVQMIALTASRSNEVRGMRWSEIDFDAAVWTIPGPRMKAGKLHRVPLSAPALAILKRLHKHRVGEYVFWSAPKRPISNNSCWRIARRGPGEGGSLHGLRATFRSWCDETAVAYHVAEKALAHAGGPLDQAYRRTDMLDQRRDLMTRWAAFLEGEDASSAKVVPLRKRAGARR